MSTRCNVVLHNQNGEQKAILYHHCDGYPDNMMPKLQSLFSKAGRLLNEKVDDPERVAAMLVALSVDESGGPQFVPCLGTHDDIEYLYRVYLDESGVVDVEVVGR